jgi:peroxiredoxin
VIRGGVLVIVLLLTGRLEAQDTSGLRVRMGLQQGANPGQHAPAVVLPYVTAQGPGPVGQPFDLAKELGHPVVLLFYGMGREAAIRQVWSGLADRWRGAVDSGLVVAGISTDSLTAQVRLASELSLPFKLMRDGDRAVERQYGVTLTDRDQWAVVVIAWDGRVQYRDLRYREADRASTLHLDAAIRAARKRP